MYSSFVKFVQELYGTKEPISLHSPRFEGNEKRYLLETIDSSFVSSVGEFVNRFEQSVAEYTGSNYAIATINGTSALHIALKLAGVEPGTEVITQSFTFIATCNAIRYCNAIPIFVDVDPKTLGLSHQSLQTFLESHAEIRDDGNCWNKTTNRRISVCLPMHSFGFPAELDHLNKLCSQYNIVLVEDAAESLGSFYKDQHTGTIGKIAIISFNGNKITTTGGGGIILTSDSEIARRAKHITTTAKIPHQWNFVHDDVGYNYRLPNLNAALGLAQMESLPKYLKQKRTIAEQYQQWGKDNGVQFLKEPKNTQSNYWLNALLTESKEERDQWLLKTNEMGVMTRPAWTPMHQLLINQDCITSDLSTTEWLFDRLINVPSSVNIK
tara:strand:- start:62 stop:1207 length:1146 start_codon:yes stop_codon:yes gene_type:complete